MNNNLRIALVGQHRPRARRDFDYSVSPSLFVCAHNAALSACTSAGFCTAGFRFVLGLRHRFDFHRPPSFCRTIEPLDNAHVCGSFHARGFRPPIVKNAVRKILQLGRKLISFTKGLFPCFVFDRDVEIDRIDVLTKQLK